MKRIYFLLLAMTVANLSWAQLSYSWNANAGGSWTLATNWTPTRTVIAASDLLTISTGTTLTITNVPTQTIGRLTVGATGAGNATILTMAGAGTMLTPGNQTGADLVVNVTSELNLSNVNVTLANNATATIAGLFSIPAGVTYDANNTNNVTTVTGTLENAGTLNVAAGDLAMSAGSFYTHLLNGGVVPLAAWNATSTCTIAGITNSAGAPTGLNQTFGHFTWNSPAQTTSFSLAGNLTDVNGNLTVTSTGTGGFYFLMSGGPVTVAVGGNYVQTGGTVTIAQSAAATTVLDVSGNMSVTGGTLAQGAGSASVTFNGAAQTYTKTAGTMTGNINFIIANNSIVNVGTSLFTGGGTFNLNGGGGIITSNVDGLYSTTATGSVQVAGARTYSSTADYEFRGANTGTFTTAGGNVNNLTFNNATGVTLSRNFIVDGALALTSGIVTVPVTRTLTVSDAGTVPVAGGPFGPTKFINTEVNTTTGTKGAFIANNISGGAYRLMPVGNGTDYLPISILTSNNTTDYSFTSFKGVTANGSPNGTPFTTTQLNMIVNAVFQITRTGGTSDYSIKPSWPAGLEGGIFASIAGTQIGVSRNSGTTWDGVLGTGGDQVNNTTTRGILTVAATGTTYSHAVGYIGIPLAVHFADLKATSTDNGVRVEWTNLTEEDVATYSVERSSNGENFTTVGQVYPKMNLGFAESYAYFDATAKGNVNFYRIRVNETTGKIIYSKILRVTSSSAKTGLAVYPNPVTGNRLQFSLTGVKQGNYKVRVVSNIGQDIFQKDISNQGNSVTTSLELPASIKPGVYTLMIKGENYNETKLFIVR